MRFDTRPILSIYSFENNRFVLKGIIDDYENCSFERNLFEEGSFTIQINFNIPNARLFERGKFVKFGDDEKDFGIITTLQNGIGRTGKASQLVTVYGYDVRHIFKRRIISNLNNGDTYTYSGCGELCMRNLIQDQCGSGTTEERRFPLINVIGEEGIGADYTITEAYTFVYDVLVTIAIQTGIGWGIKFNQNRELELYFYNGVNRSSTVRFDTDYESLENGEFEDSDESYINAVYIGGKGQGANRDIYLGESSETESSPSGFERFETWSDNSNLVEDSEYENESINILNQYNQTLVLRGAGLAKCPYIYKSEYDVGDNITVRFNEKEVKTRIISVQEVWERSGYKLSFEFGKPVETIQRQLRNYAKKINTYNATKDSETVTSVKTYTVPTDTSMPRKDVTNSFIGFNGDTSSNPEFMLYYDDTNKVGSKAYYITVNLSGDGFLILKTGYDSLKVYSGNYVLVIYIDAEGKFKKIAGETESERQKRTVPTDAVLHYSFDEVPDLPDGNADYNLKDGQTYAQLSLFWEYGATGITTNENGNIKVTTATQYVGIYLRNNYTVGKIAKIKIKVTKGSVYIRGVGIVGVGEYYQEFITSTTAQLIYAATSTETIFYVTEVYIGGGSYNTPIIDNAGGKYQATNNGGLAVEGVSGKGIKGLNGKYLSIPNFHFPQNYTVSLWFNPSDNTSGKQNDIISKGSEFILRNGATWSNRLMCYQYGADGTEKLLYLTTNALTPNEWQHLVVIKNGASLKCYNNGVLIYSGVCNETQKNATGNLSIFNPTSTRESSVDDLQIFNRALSEEEILGLYLAKGNTPKFYSYSDWWIAQQSVPSTASAPLSLSPLSIAPTEESEIVEDETENSGQDLP